MNEEDVRARRWRGVIGRAILESFNVSHIDDLAEGKREACKLIAAVAEISYRRGFLEAREPVDIL